MFYFEYEKLFTEKTKILSSLKHRKKATLLLWHKKQHYLEYNPIVPRESSTGKITGTPASKGVVSGVARIILGPSQFKNFKKGQILVSEMTRPDFLPLMKIAKAIITDEGGLTCHAAIVARELGIPCIVGTFKATSVIKDGQSIEVDANKGEVKIL
jgi:phosphoenolpyruvate synthase/pyruvate phosphate dikinase